MRSLQSFYRLLNLMSVDVAIGAVICASFFAKLFNVQLFFPAFFTLGLTVWIIYSVDHLYDAYKLKRKASTARHLFHQRYFQAISVMVGIACCCNFIMIWYLRPPIFSYGSVLSCGVVLYLIFQRWIHPLKEVIVALFYSFGVALPAIAMGTSGMSGSIVFLMLVFFLTALINLVLFSWFDEKHDRDSQTNSLITFFGKDKGRVLLLILFSVQGFLLLILFFCSVYYVEAILLVSMNSVLGLLFMFSEKFRKHDLYRLIGDVIFIFPITYLLFHGQ